MADKSYYIYDKETDTHYPIKLMDNGDGTYRMAVEIAGASFGDVSIGDVEVANLKVIKAISVTPVVHIGDSIASKSLMADKITLTDAVRSSGGGGRIKTVIIGDLAYQKKDMDLVFFNADPTNTTWTKDLMFDIDDADLPKIIGIVNIEDTDWASFKDNSAICKEVDIAFNAVGSADIFVALIARYTITFTTASDLNIHVVIEQD